MGWGLGGLSVMCCREYEDSQMIIEYYLTYCCTGREER